MAAVSIVSYEVKKFESQKNKYTSKVNNFNMILLHKPQFESSNSLLERSLDHYLCISVKLIKRMW